MTTLVARILHRAAPPAEDRVTLDYEGRFLRRRTLTTDAGTTLLVDLAETVSVEDGDAFETTDGRRIGVHAAAETLLEILAPPERLARLAWHIGNRHTPAEIAADRLRIRRDHVLAHMLVRLGAEIREVTVPFRPEGGAYGTGRTHGHADDRPHVASQQERPGAPGSSRHGAG